MIEKEDMRYKRVHICIYIYIYIYIYIKKSKKNYLRKRQNFKHVMDVGFMFINLLKKYDMSMSDVM